MIAAAQLQTLLRFFSASVIAFAPKGSKVIYTGGTKIAGHGGFSDDDTHVALLVSHIGQQPRIVSQPVRTAQVAPTTLEALGIEGERLETVRREWTQELPALQFYGHW